MSKSSALDISRYAQCEAFVSTSRVQSLLDEVRYFGNFTMMSVPDITSSCSFLMHMVKLIHPSHSYTYGLRSAFLRCLPEFIQAEVCAPLTPTNRSSIFKVLIIVSYCATTPYCEILDPFADVQCFSFSSGVCVPSNHFFI